MAPFIAASALWLVFPFIDSKRRSGSAFPALAIQHFTLAKLASGKIKGKGVASAGQLNAKGLVTNVTASNPPAGGDPCHDLETLAMAAQSGP